MRNDIYCLMFQGRPLSQQIRTVLFRTAQAMFFMGKERLAIKCDECDGLVTTKFQAAALGGISGFEFRAELEIEDGKTEARFIARPVDFEKIDLEDWKDENWQWAAVPLERLRAAVNAYLN